MMNPTPTVRRILTTVATALLCLCLVAQPVTAVSRTHNATGLAADSATTGVQLKPGIWVARIAGDFDGGATVDLEYLEPAVGAVWRNVGVGTLVAVAAAMANPVEIRVSAGLEWRWVVNGGTAPDIDCTMGYGGAG